MQVIAEDPAMQNVFIQALRDSNVPGYRNFQQLSEIGSRAVRRLAEIQYRLAAIGIDGTVGHARLLASTPNYAELVQAQSALASDCGNRLIAIGYDAAQALTETREEWVAWLQKEFVAAPKPAQHKSKGKVKNAARRRTARRAA